jgi:cell division transport system ATP-binding protein
LHLFISATTMRPDEPRAAGRRRLNATGSIVQFENVGLRYGTGAETLSDLSFSLKEGGFYFLTGPSGAGKTSLLKLLYLALRPSRGLIRLFGEDIVTMPRGRLPGFRRRIGVVFQEFRLVSHLSTFDNVALPLRVAGVEEKDLEKPVSEMLAWVGLADRATARPATLSGGEQQRVAIARAVIGRPELLVADEPTGNVDPEMALRLLHLFDSLNKLGTTVIVATHDLHLLARIQRAEMLRLDRGQISDPTGALRHPPRRPEA